MGDNTDVAGFLANMDESAPGLGGAAGNRLSSLARAARPGQSSDAF